MMPDIVAAEKRRIRAERSRLLTECWAFLRTCQDGEQWETIAHLLWQLKALDI